MAMFWEPEILIRELDVQYFTQNISRLYYFYKKKAAKATYKINE